MIEVLIAAGADVNAVSSDGLTPLHVAAIANPDPAVVSSLVTSGAELGAKDGAGRTPFYYAKRNKLMKETDGDGYRILEMTQ